MSFCNLQDFHVSHPFDAKGKISKCFIKRQLKLIEYMRKSQIILIHRDDYKIFIFDTTELLGTYKSLHPNFISCRLFYLPAFPRALCNFSDWPPIQQCTCPDLSAPVVQTVGGASVSATGQPTFFRFAGQPPVEIHNWSTCCKVFQPSLERLTPNTTKSSTSHSN